MAVSSKEEEMDCSELPKIGNWSGPVFRVRHASLFEVSSFAIPRGY